MKPGVALLRAVALVCTGLALTACGGALTEEEAAAMEAEALASQEAEVGSCANWSTEWTNSGYTYCGESTLCGYYWVCEPWARKGDSTPSARAGGDGESAVPVCPDGYEPVRYGNPATMAQQYIYRVCWNEDGSYSHTEYQYRYTRSYCGC